MLFVSNKKPVNNMMVKSLLISGFLIALSGCATRSAEVISLPTPPTAVAQENGTAQFVWEEPMVDVIEVPPGLDPDGVYYRPAHQEVVEIRQGRWKHYNKNP